MRKKQKQITFLHVYHHAGMVVLSWSIVKWLPGNYSNHSNYKNTTNP